MFTYTIGKWTLIFEQNYRIIQDESTAVVIDSERTALVLISLTADGNICIERTYYDMINIHTANLRPTKSLGVRETESMAVGD